VTSSLALLVSGAILSAAEPETIDFARDVAPLIQQRCLRCHQPSNRKGELSLATAADLKESGFVVPRDPDASHLLSVVTAAANGRPAMPKEGRALSVAEVAMLRRWISAGAEWPEKLVLKEKPRADASWWSLQPLAQIEPPQTEDLPEAWAKSPIDRFVFARLHDKGLTPNPPAGRRELIRRVTYDLTGLPPSPEEVETFVRDDAADAYDRLVDRLLASPHYGEQWGRHWLDVVRFGESNGYERNVLINNIWPFRDYIIKSFNDDKPFDQLTLEHLAGDVIGRDDPDREIGTAFLVCGPYDNVGNQDAAQAAMIRANHLDEMIRATTETFLGLTFGCTRCHDHKFDPITQQDYYALYATLAGVRHGDRELATPEKRREHEAALRPLQEKRERLAKEQEAIQRAVRDRGGDAGATPEEQAMLEKLKTQLDEVSREIAKVPPLLRQWAGTFDPEAGRQTYRVFLGGDPQKPGAEVSIASPSTLAGLASRYQLPAQASESDRRIALAKWIVATDNPLTPRVLANRLWHYHFGTGIVDTPSDFGWMGGTPTHPELLDWLARQVHAHGWRLKPLHRLIVTSQTYRQSSAPRDEAAKVDGDSRLLWRFPPRRLAAEEIRDSMLHIAGRLDLDKQGGPGFQLYRYVQDNVATYHPLDEPGPETYRRSVYHQNARAAQVDVLSDFDCPDPAASAPRRAATTTPSQALALLHHRFVHDVSRMLAERVTKDAGGQPEDQVRRAVLLAYGRPPDDEELARCKALVEQHGIKALCLALLNSNELIYLR
jgi:hypothetical protein